MGLSIWHILVVAILVLVLFGRGKIPQIMGDLGKGLRNFKDGISGEGDKKDNLPPPDNKGE
ncbi:MAG: twin-arginine translocase TatA/TatE family subunit [Alphaproteobacteria bacterium]|nr:twin-arginine translocase TatA/TatE family subunit [Alphaproteobacteria bacterium]HCS23546.1 twin-arginine translocase TatA/TatE family subunit [Rhodospirillaceae bacterium]HRI77737.1 twin-arginine translocase TatA/TatE family subunit [Alphaproteobacteria bacterium]